MPAPNPLVLSGVAETLLIPLCIRAMESARPDAILKDEKAAALVQQLGCDPRHILEKIAEESRIAKLLNARQIDRCAQEFLHRHPHAVAVHLGCGLDCRFERVDNGQVEWYDLDLPEVIDLRRRLLPPESERYHLLACSVLESEWLAALPPGNGKEPRPFLFLAEGVLMYLTAEQVRVLVLTLQRRFPGCELVFDAFTPFLVWANNLRVKQTGVGTPATWGLKRGQELERWNPGIQLLEQAFPYLMPEPRLQRTRFTGSVRLLSKSLSLLHYRLG